MRFTSWQWRSSADKKATLARNTDADRLRRIGRALLATIGPGTPATREWPRRVILVDARTPNAFCWSDGTISVNTGLLQALTPTDDELAFVIGHEMAHAIRGHGRDKTLENVLLGFASALAGFLFSRRAADWAWLFGNLACQRMSRNDEKEADRIGMWIAANAGFDPRAAFTFLEKVATPETRTPLDWFSTHPLRRERLRHIQANLMGARRFRPEG